MNDAQPSDRVATVRAFNRLYTGVIGVLDEGPADAEYSLSEARVLFEAAQRESTSVPDLRKRLELDAGYASRLLGKLESRGLLVRERSETDARRQVITLTEAGRDAFGVLNKRSSDKINALLHQFDEDQQRRLLGAMNTISGLVEPRRENPTLVLRPPRPGDLGWVVHRHGVLYAREYGWDETFEALVAKVASEFLNGQSPAGLGNARQAGWIAEVDGEPVGSVFCMPGPDEKIAKLRLLLLEPGARGLGVGKRLVGECVEFARASGYASMELWTVSLLAAARGIYERAGFRLAEEEPVKVFGADVVSQTWRLTL
ncbi:helix-turn-helix domain-containing GNAT family N-acetyltransferase [Amycolatopsis sp.]|jgi:DNA-binding MarR family transcriptional regulator/GNAT superfamily N-acetyltransferase|uniref:bifunctional helix-turn-helix transcriptional regulator/GNAT family N-acetyltransferase n=1 Tax=Amycolatopsis sp. TaxID=37632 RepID=UPI002E0C66EE|nr:helix-turn-helix domain-containing GNAT family N-acetyltransferase [Amycolatopsis sp.]